MISTLAGRKNKMMKDDPKLYSALDLICLDATYFLLFNGTPEFKDKKSNRGQKSSFLNKGD